MLECCRAGRPRIKQYRVSCQGDARRGVVNVQSLPGKRGSSAWVTLCGALRELPAPCGPCRCCHRGVLCHHHLGCPCSRPSAAADGSATDGCARRDPAFPGAADRVGDLILARVVGLDCSLPLRPASAHGVGVASRNHEFRLLLLDILNVLSQRVFALAFGGEGDVAIVEICRSRIIACPPRRVSASLVRRHFHHD